MGLTLKKTSIFFIFTLWPEAESNCRPLVFQTEANHLTFHHFTLMIINICSFIRGSKTQRAVNNEDFFCECVALL